MRLMLAVVVFVALAAGARAQPTFTPEQLREMRQLAVMDDFGELLARAAHCGIVPGQRALLQQRFFMRALADQPDHMLIALRAVLTQGFDRGRANIQPTDCQQVASRFAGFALSIGITPEDLRNAAAAP